MAATTTAATTTYHHHYLYAFLPASVFCLYENVAPAPTTSLQAASLVGSSDSVKMRYEEGKEEIRFPQPQPWQKQWCARKRQCRAGLKGKEWADEGQDNAWLSGQPVCHTCFPGRRRCEEEGW